MTYKETLLFVCKCLTLGLHPERVTEVKKEIKKGKVVWEQVVKLSSGQFVLPALYIRFKEASLLPELPSDLVEYMEYLTGLNRERNLQIIEQIKEIVALLNEHSITPVFLKGTAHLLLPLYDDIAERMVGDIDFLVEESEMEKTAQLFMMVGYEPLSKFNPETLKITKHYPRLTNFNYPAAVEVHRQVIVPPFDIKFNSSEIIKEKQKTFGQLEVFVPSYRHLIIHNALNTQVNDKAYLWVDVNLRQLYDLLLLSKLENPQVVVKAFAKFPKLTNAWLASASLVFGKPAGIEYDKNLRVKLFLKRFNFFLLHPGYLHSAYKSIIYILWRFSRYFVIPLQSIYNKKVRAGLWFRISDPQWYKSHVLSYWNYFKPAKKFSSEEL
jgi:hypothetical protein